MDKPHTPRWPDDYRNWTGTIKELADTAGFILRTLDPDIKAPNIRLLRYYQQSGVMSRGQMQRGQAIFGFEDLERVVAAKGLVKQNWTLDQAVSLMDSHHSPVSSLLYASPEESAPLRDRASTSQAVVESQGVAPAAPAPGTARSAQDVVARLMAKSGALDTHPKAPPAALNAAHVAQAQGMVFPTAPTPRVLRGVPAPFVAAPKGVASPPSPQPLLGIQAAPWMTVYLDEAAARHASPTDRKAAIDVLVSALRSLS